MAASNSHHDFFIWYFIMYRFYLHLYGTTFAICKKLSGRTLPFLRMKHIYKIGFLFFLISLPNEILAANGDSILIAELKSFILKETGFELDKNFFTGWSKSEEPAVVLFVSSSTRVNALGDTESHFIGYGYDEAAAVSKAKGFDSLGRHTFVYKTYGSARAELSKRFLSYSHASISFVVLHEFVHHYTRDRKLALPFVYNEALGEVVGNYGAIEFAKLFGSISTKQAKAQRSRIEDIYEIINKTTQNINNGAGNVNELNLSCQKQIAKILRAEDLFQDDRFGYDVNNAYLFKNRLYAEKYFLLKEVLIKSGSISNLLTIVQGCPADPIACEKYFRDFLKSPQPVGSGRPSSE